MNHMYRYSNYLGFVNLAVVLDINRPILELTDDGCMVVCLQFRHRLVVDLTVRDTEDQQTIGRNQSRTLK